MLVPRKLKYRKMQKGPLPQGKESRGNFLAFGKFGLQAMESGIIKDKQLEALRLAIVRSLKGKGKLWLRIFPHQPITFKGVEASMGGGKGDPIGYITKVKEGRIIIELDGIDEELAKKVIKNVSYKLPLKTRFIKSY